MPNDDLAAAADLTRRAIEALDRAGSESDLAAAALDHALTQIEQLRGADAPAEGTPAAAD